MSLNQQRTNIENLLMTEFGVSDPNLVLMGENADTDPPTDSAWVRMSITVLNIHTPCVGNKGSEQTDAIFNFQVFTPKGQGAGEASMLADAAKEILKGSTLNGISFNSFDIPTGQIEGGWYNLLLRATYRARD